MTDEKTNEEKKRDALIAGGIFAILVGLWYAKTAPKRRKLKKIREWKLMNFKAIENAAERLRYIHNDPDVTHEEFAQAVKDEKSFLNIVRNQPKF